MNPSDFKQAREARLKAFESKYAASKKEYTEALQQAMAEQDRPSQCVLIKKALDKNNELTRLINEMITPSGSGGCSLTPDRIRALNADIEKYKAQHESIQHDRDRVHALQKAYWGVENRIKVLHGIETIYIVLLVLASILLVILVFQSGIHRIFNAQSVTSVVPRSLT
jgi:hypothetical protein